MKTIIKQMTVGLLAVLLLACPGGDASSSSDPSTLVVWVTNPQAAGNTTSAVYFKALKEAYLQQNPDLKLLLAMKPEAGVALIEKAKAAMVEYKGPDLIQAQGGTLIAQYAEADRLLDLTNELADVKGSVAALAAMRWNDKTFGVAPFFSVAGLFVNEGKFQELGLKVPKTIPEMESAAEALKAKGVQPFAVDAGDTRPIFLTYMYLVNRIGGDAFAQVVRRTLRFDTPVFIEAAEKLRDWAKKGYFGAIPLTGGAGTAQALMSQGKAGMTVAESRYCGYYADATKTKETIGFYAFPTLPGGKGATTDMVGATEVGFYALVKDGMKNDMIVKFMHTAMSTEILRTGAGMIPSIPEEAPANRILGMAEQEFAKALTLQFYWEKELPSSYAGPEFIKLVPSFLLPETDIQAACKKFEQALQSEMGSTVEETPSN